MEKKSNKGRRTFLSSLALGVGGIFVAGFSTNSEKNDDDEMEKKKILGIKPLGFQWETKDPFLFCVHHEDDYPKGNDELGPAASLDGRQIGQDFLLKDGWRMYHGSRVPGFPSHPHRGFETITVVRNGLVDHADSMGAAGRYGNGDVQWMTSGKGVLHSEMFPLLNKEEGNPLELFQIWLNLPKKNKMVEPHFTMMWSDSIPNYKVNDENSKGVLVEVIAGTLLENVAPSPPPDSWASEEDNHVGIYNIKLDPNKDFTLPKTAKGVNRTIYFYEGNALKIEGEEIPKYHGVEVDPEFDLLLESGDELLKILVLEGKPIGEPVVQHGPFVMNTREEINQAFLDYQNTQFGGWPWDKSDQTHDREKERFALHGDGTEELKKEE